MFAAGDRVRTQLAQPPGHTRLPRYLCGRAGQVIAVLGRVPYADRRARGERDAHTMAYTVRFAAADVWGEGASGWICADLFEPYLTAAR